MDEKELRGVLESNQTVLEAVKEALEAYGEVQEGHQRQLKHLGDVAEGSLSMHQTSMAKEIALSTLLIGLWARVLQEGEIGTVEEFKPWLLRNLTLANGNEIEVDAHMELEAMADEIVKAARNG